MIRCIKTSLALVSLLLLCFHAPAQDKTELYCKVIVLEAPLGKARIKLDLGDERQTTFGNRLRDTLGRVMKFNSEIDALNYMSSLGWKLFFVVPVSNGDPGDRVFYFKRES